MWVVLTPWYACSFPPPTLDYGPSTAASSQLRLHCLHFSSCSRSLCSHSSLSSSSRFCSCACFFSRTAISSFCFWQSSTSNFNSSITPLASILFSFLQLHWSLTCCRWSSVWYLTFNQEAPTSSGSWNYSGFRESHCCHQMSQTPQSAQWYVVTSFLTEYKISYYFLSINTISTSSAVTLQYRVQEPNTHTYTNRTSLVFEISHIIKCPSWQT